MNYFFCFFSYLFTEQMEAARSYTEHTNYHDNLESYLQILPYIVVFLLNRLFRFRFIFFFHTRQKCVAGEK